VVFRRGREELFSKFALKKFVLFRTIVIDPNCLNSGSIFQRRVMSFCLDRKTTALTRNEWLLSGIELDTMELRSVPIPDGRRRHWERPLFGLSGLWQFSEKAVGTACWNVRFQLFRTVTFDTLLPFDLLRSSRSVSATTPSKTINPVLITPRTAQSVPACQTDTLGSECSLRPRGIVVALPSPPLRQ
jgi:hypothetical protein